MQPRIQTLKEKKLIGTHLTTSLVNNKTGELWGNFMPRRNEILNAVSTNLYSLQTYPTNYFANFDPEGEFEKWALVEVADLNQIPEGMDTFFLEEGLYAVFNYKGSSSESGHFFQKIFTDWLPNSAYALDDRPHFEVLGENYKNNDSNSEEEIWIPVKPKV